MPRVVEAASIYSGYTPERPPNPGAKLIDGGYPTEFGATHSASVGGSGRYIDRPAITRTWCDVSVYRVRGQKGLPLVTFPSG